MKAPDSITEIWLQFINSLVQTERCEKTPDVRLVIQLLLRSTDLASGGMSVGTDVSSAYVIEYPWQPMIPTATTKMIESENNKLTKES